MVCVAVILVAQTDGCLSDKLVQSVQISDFELLAMCTCLLFSEPSPK